MVNLVHSNSLQAKNADNILQEVAHGRLLCSQFDPLAWPQVTPMAAGDIIQSRRSRISVKVCRCSCRKIRGMPSRLSDAEMLQYRSTVYGVASTVGHIPRMHMGRLRWTAGMEASAEAARAGQSSMLQLPPEALEVGQRISSAGDFLSPCARLPHPPPPPPPLPGLGYHLGRAGMYARVSQPAFTSADEILQPMKSLIDILLAEPRSVSGSRQVICQASAFIDTTMSKMQASFRSPDYPAAHFAPLQCTCLGCVCLM